MLQASRQAGRQAGRREGTRAGRQAGGQAGEAGREAGTQAGGGCAGVRATHLPSSMQVASCTSTKWLAMTWSLNGTILSEAISGSCCSGCSSLSATCRGALVSAGMQKRPAGCRTHHAHDAHPTTAAGARTDADGRQHRQSWRQAAAAQQPLFVAGTRRVLRWMQWSQQAVHLLLLWWIQRSQQPPRLLLLLLRRRASSPATGWSSVSWSVNCSSRRNSAWYAAYQGLTASGASAA